jgi:hypothetical protein
MHYDGLQQKPLIGWTTWFEQRHRLPRGRQRVDGIERAAEEGERREHQVDEDLFQRALRRVVMNGPNAGQISPMTTREFVLGKAGVTIAVIRPERGIVSARWTASPR